MSVSDASSQVVICPGCGRRVPRRVDVCRCGFRLAAVYGSPPETSFDVEKPEARPRRWVPILVIAAGLALVGVGIWYTSQRQTAASQASVPAPAPHAGSASPQALAAPPPGSRLQTPGKADPPGTLRTPGTLGTPGAPETPGTLEEVISQAMPAVVSIETPTTRGSGFFISPGLVVTNAHVVETNGYVTVRLAAGQAVNGRVTLTNAEYDLALVRVDPVRSDQSVLPPRSALDVRVGQEVIAIGSALGVLQNTVTRGIISGVRRAGSVVLLQTDAAINPGNSGGPLLDRNGRVIGVTTMKVGQSAESIGFAVAIDYALMLVAGKQSAPSASSSAPPLLPSQPPRPSAPSPADDAREAGIQAFERAMQVLEERADQIDGAWAAFRARCSPRARAVTGDREWFGIWDDRAQLGTQVRDCATWLDDIVLAANQVRSAMMTADELARRAQVYPGVQRDIRRRHKLDWTGWER